MSASDRVAWYAVCLDVSGHGGPMAEFWAAVLGLRLQPASSPGILGNLVGPPGADVALCAVPEPRRVKHRVHLDVHAESVEALVGLGADVIEQRERWTVMSDPEGGEFCAFVREEPPAYRLYEIAVDAADGERIAGWWAARFGVGVHRGGEEPWWSVEVPDAPFGALVFATVPESKAVKNRVHWDVTGEVAGLVAVGAQVLWETPGWTTMADPEGNEFCVFAG